METPPTPKLVGQRVADADAIVRPRPDNHFSSQLRGFAFLGILAIVVIFASNYVLTPIGAVLALVWTWLSNTPWREIGYVRPTSWPRDIAIGVIFGTLLKFLMKAVVMPPLGAPDINPAYHFLAGNAPLALRMVAIVVLFAGFGEETFYRGYLFERLGKLFGSSVWAKVAIVAITSAFFASVHYGDQGLPGVEQAAFTGLAFGSVFARTGRIFMLMVAHTAFDLTALGIIYWDVEAEVAHLIFK